ncbi:MAG: 4-hydroxyphenylacetate 3-hydroxylase N-terminal domain-containing protein [Bacillota bacterium]|nr:4-hydroxyphenylacetate 3-hydroxylase N-terminal domain-containing protein [Bacillota bacterium]MDW7682781.1 4-hydroxyphenylacetate 3-hydroxylase N-terminal domain-containing protein [Bacillota bacterium]
MLRSGEEYRQGIAKKQPRLYLGGEKVTSLEANPVMKSVLEATAKMFELALEPEHAEVMTAKSHLTGKTINRNLHISHSIEDLEKRAEMALLTSQKLGTCNYRCVGCDCLNALASVTWEMDKVKGTDYHQRFNTFLTYLQDNDLACTGAVTDAKGDRRKKMDEVDPDMYVHVSEQNEDGIIVRGAKLHQSGATVADETIVITGGAYRPGDEKFAVAFAVENSAPGLTYIAQHNAYSAERETCGDISELGNPLYGQRETCMMIFEDVFIPWERVFLCGETEFTGKLISRFAKVHRMNCGGACKVGFADIIIGASLLASEFSGTDKVPHIREMVTEMVRHSEAAHACTIAAAVKGREEPEGSGVFMPDDMFGNVAKITTAYGFWQIMALAGDIAGGLVVTAPSLKDLKNEETRPYLEKYLAAAAPAEKRLRITKVLQNWTAGLHGPGTWHGAGSPQAQKIALYRAANLDEKKKVAREIAGLEEE